MLLLYMIWHLQYKIDPPRIAIRNTIPIIIPIKAASDKPDDVIGSSVLSSLWVVVVIIGKVVGGKGVMHVPFISSFLLLSLHFEKAWIYK